MIISFIFILIIIILNILRIILNIVGIILYLLGIYLGLYTLVKYKDFTVRIHGCSAATVFIAIGILLFSINSMLPIFIFVVTWFCIVIFLCPASAQAWFKTYIIFRRKKAAPIVLLSK